MATRNISKRLGIGFLAFFCLCGQTVWADSSVTQRRHALSLHGTPKYGPQFKHFDYVNPSAPKGGEIRHFMVGTFDTLNPFILKGSAAVGGGVFETLMVGSDDEAFTMYGLLAESAEVASDNTWIIFHLRPQARFHDGTPVTADDVAYSFDTLTTKGNPLYRAYYADIQKAEAIDQHTVKFHFRDGKNRELPLIIGQLPILSRAYWAQRDFSKTTLQPPLGSGPYKIATVDVGRSIVYERVPDYWGKDLPVNTGRYNFDRIRYDYYRDDTVAMEAFKAGAYDFRLENSAKSWATAYDGPAFKRGEIRKEKIAHERPAGMQAFAFNTRKEIFTDPRVRKAMNYAFDFGWTNKNLFYNSYIRSTSYFANSELASRGSPDAAEIAILEPYRGELPEALFTKAFTLPRSDGSGNIRLHLRKAAALLDEAGWIIKGGRRVNKTTGTALKFELLLATNVFERIALPFRRNLAKLGINMRIRTVDSAQYEKRIEDFDFDMAVVGIRQSLSPGNEQRNFWSSRAADTPGSDNFIGIKSPVVDALVEQVINAPDRQSLIEHTRALDRVLLWNYYVIPHWHINYFRVAYWDKFVRPKVTPRYDLALESWWVDPAKESKLKRQR